MSRSSTSRPWVIGITDRVVPPADIEQQAFPEAEFRFLSDWRLAEENREEWRDVDALLVWRFPINRDTIKLLDRCRIVVRYGVGYDNLDIQALAEQKIAACNTPDYGTEEVADTACGMILALQRKLFEYDRACRVFDERWQGKTIRPIQRTSQRTLGIIGVGRIGTAVAIRMKSFGYRVVGYDPYQPPGHEKAVGYQRVDELDALLRQADIISIHCPLTDETRGMVNAEFFHKMSTGSSLVNTARGGILADLDCLEQALRSGHLASVAVDVLPEEPPEDHALVQAWQEDATWLRGRLIITPHTAFYSEQAWFEMRFKAAETTRLFLVTGRLRNQIEE
jgi:D-3-phosphoglycerate dehydrogenase